MITQHSRRGILLIFGSLFLSLAFTSSNALAQEINLEAPFRTQHKEFRAFDTRLLQSQIKALTKRDTSGLSDFRNLDTKEGVTADLTKWSVASLPNTPNKLSFDIPAAAAWGKVLQVGAVEVANKKIEISTVERLVRDIVYEMVLETEKNKETNVHTQVVESALNSECPDFPWHEPSPSPSSTPKKLGD